jgi:hypothetical protein
MIRVMVQGRDGDFPLEWFEDGGMRLEAGVLGTLEVRGERLEGVRWEDGGMKRG